MKSCLIQEWINLTNQQFKTILMHCTGLVRFVVSHKVLKHLRWYFASYAGRSSKLAPSFISNLLSFFTLHCFLSFSVTLWYCMVISLVSPWCYFKPQKMHTTLLRNWGFESCCSGFRQRWTWLLRIIRWIWLLRSYTWKFFWVAKCWIKFRVLANVVTITQKT